MGNNKIHAKTIILITVCFLVLASTLTQTTLGVTYTRTAYVELAERNTYQYMGDIDPADIARVSAETQLINATVGGYLSYAIFSLQRVGDPMADLAVRLESCGNDWTDEPNGTVLAVSGPVNAYGLANSSFVDVTFTFAETYQMVAGMKYAIIIFVQSGSTYDDSNHVRVGIDSDAPAYVGERGDYSDAGWTMTDASDLVFEVYVSNVGIDGSGTSSWSSSDTGELIEDFASFIIPISVMLLPAILFVIFFKRTDKWLILIGLAIGTGLGFYFGMIPVWLVFLVAIGLIGLAYSEVRRNG